jgi:DNA oxidative demethylase
MAKERKKIIYVTQPPEGLFYIPKFLSAEEERAILREVEAQPFEPYDHHGYKANREVVYFGTGDYSGGTTERVQMPDWMLALRDRFAHVMELRPEEIAMGMTAKYTTGAGIGWHRYRPQFGPTIMGISLESDAEMRFRRYIGDKEELFKINLEHGSAYLMSGPARSVWQHGMNPVKTLRYSITFRTLNDKVRDPIDPRHKPERITQRLAELSIKYATWAPEPPPENAPAARQLKLAF